MTKALRHAFAALLAVLTPAAGFAQAQPAPAAPAEIAIPRSQRHELTSRINGIGYQLSIFLPAGYTRSQDHYPVLYFIDGQFFGPTMATTAGILSVGDMPKVIVVGIDSTDPEFHFMDLPTAGPDPHWNVPANRGAANFLRVLLEEIKPWVDDTYRTDPADTGIGGHSLGGFFALYALMHAPGQFRHVYASSPSFDWQDNVLLRIEAELAQTVSDLPARVFVDQGGLEDQTPDLANLTRAITGRGYPSLRWQARTAQGQSHQTVAFADAVDALYAIYGPELRRPQDAELAALAGSYAVSDGTRLTLEADGGKLFLAHFRSLERVEMQSSAPGQWFVRYLWYRMDVAPPGTDGPALTFHLQPTPGPNGEITTPTLTAVRVRPGQ